MVISAVEGVQPQTLILWRTLQRLGIPTLIFVNKIDRPGADAERVMSAVSMRLTKTGMPVGVPHDVGTAAASFALSGDETAFRASLAELFAESDERFMAAYLDDASEISYQLLRDELAAQTRRALVQPIFFGSAITGAGVPELMSGVAELLPAAGGDPDGPVSASVFKIERGEGGEKVAFVRLFSGTIRVRDRLRVGAGDEEKVTAIAVFEHGPAVQRSRVSAGHVAKLWGLSQIHVGDSIGETSAPGGHGCFPPPTLESVVVCDSHDRGRLYQALAQLAEQDPLINVRQDDARAEISVSLYGEVQQEVIQATLASDYGIAVGFREATTIYIERPLGSGETVEVLHAKTKSNVTGKSSPNSSNPFLATLGLRVDPAPAGTGVEFRLEVEVRLLPIYIYKTIGNLINHMQQYIRETLQEGLAGWKVTDCTVTMTDCGYRAPGTTAADFRRLTPLVLMQALKQAQTVPCEPMLYVRLELPTTAVGTVGAELGRLGLALETTSISHDQLVIETVMPAAQAQHLQRQLPALTGGEGALDSTFAGYQPVTNIRPTRPRTTPNPLNLDEYLMHLPGRAKGGI